MLHIFSSCILGERSSNSRIVDFHLYFTRDLSRVRTSVPPKKMREVKSDPPHYFLLFFVTGPEGYYWQNLSAFPGL